MMAAYEFTAVIQGTLTLHEPYRKLTDYHIALIRGLRDDGLSPTQIGRRIAEMARRNLL